MKELNEEYFRAFYTLFAYVPFVDFFLTKAIGHIEQLRELIDIIELTFLDELLS
jgi:hypothetical protein